MAETVVILNPAAGGKGRPEAVRAVLAELGEAEFHETTAPGHATEIARTAALQGANTVVVMGGDGTIGQVAQGLAHTETALAVVPFGTANDYVRTFGIPNDVVRAAQLVHRGHVDKVDLARLPDGRMYANIAGVGFDAAVSRNFDLCNPVVKRLGPKTRYYWSILKTFGGYRPAPATVTLDGTDTEVDGLVLLAAGVTKYYGAGMKVLPEADPSDGLLETVWAGGLRFVELLGLLKAIETGAHVGHKKVTSARAKTVKVTTARPVPFHLDGDVSGETTFVAECVPRAVNLCVP